MKRIKPGAIRWPGGCLQISMTGAMVLDHATKRPRRVNFWADTTYKITESYKQLDSGPQKYEPNWFGTNEFMQFCRLAGAQPYFAANVRSLKVKDFIDWIEYCNAAGDDLV